MQYRYSVLGALGLASNAMAAYIPSEPWSTLTPEASAIGSTDYTATFGIQIIATTAASDSKAKRDVVTQIGDGQIQGTTATAAAVVTQIGDGQIQGTTSTAAAVVTQIGDGQIQGTTSTAAAVVTQIGDGQIQGTTSTAAAVVTQIGDGQIQGTTSTAAVVTQIGDGQIQGTTSTNTVSGATQISDGQVQQTTATSAGEKSNETGSNAIVACLSEGSLSMTLNSSILTDGAGRIGSIVANRQFQFDGPPPQAGAIYAAGWSITDDGKLALGDNTLFYQCLSGNFYNLYDQHIGSDCDPVYLEIVDLISC